MKNMSHNKEISGQSFDKIVVKLTSDVEENSFKVLHIHDVQATFAGKGIDHSPYKIIEFCRAPAAKKILDINPYIGLFLPCRIVVFQQGDTVQISAMSPLLISEFFPNANLGDLPAQIDTDIANIINNF